MNLFKAAFAALLASTLMGVAIPAYALPVTHQFSLEDAGGNAVYTGTLSIDDSRLTPNTFTPFNDPNFFSLSITTGARTYTLANADEPAIDGIVTDIGGGLTAFVDSTPGATTSFVSLGTPNIFLTIDSSGNWMEFLFGPPFKVLASGTQVSFVAVPEPATLTLFALGLAGLLLIAQRKRAAHASRS